MVYQKDAFIKSTLKNQIEVTVLNVTTVNIIVYKIKISLSRED